MKCAPSAELRPFIEYYWLSRWDRRETVARDASALLDPCVHLQVQDGRAHIMGVMRGAFRTHIEGLGFIAGVKFRVGGFYPFVQRPVAEWTDRVVDACTVFAMDEAWCAAMSDGIAACTGEDAGHATVIARHFDAAVGARVPEVDETVDEVSTLVAHVAANADVRRIGDLVQVSGRSERTLHRLFARYVGVSPAWIIRRYRLHEAARRLTASPPADARDVAWELGYADQAHFIRDFRATIGVTPGVYVQQRTAR